MGYIYKITNKLNNKCYIGQTIKKPEKRFQQHKNNYNKSYFSQLVLYKAFNKYGIENFDFEVIEEVDNSLLNDKEKYWIEYYDSYFNGYNSTLGGRLVELYNWDIDDIIEKYMILKSARAVAKAIGCDHSSIDHILNQNKIYRFTIAEQKSRPVILIKDNEKYEFDTTMKAADWLRETGQSKAKTSKITKNSILEAINKHKTYLGYNISYKDENKK